MAELEGEVAQLAGMLPRLQTSSYGKDVMELKGTGWLFNPKAPFDASILRGKMTPQEYTSSINAINRAHMQKMVGKDRIFGPSEIPARRRIGKTAVEEAIKALNVKAVGYRWDVQASLPTTTVTGVNNYGDGSGATTEHKQETSLLLIFDKM